MKLRHRVSNKRTPAGVTAATLRKLALRLEETVEGTSYGTAGYFVKGKLFARLHQTEDAIVLKTDFDSRDVLLLAAPDVFYITAHYRNYPWVLVRMSMVTAGELADVLNSAWSSVAPKRLLGKHAK